MDRLIELVGLEQRHGIDLGQIVLVLARMRLDGVKIGEQRVEVEIPDARVDPVGHGVIEVRACSGGVLLTQAAHVLASGVVLFGEGVGARLTTQMIAQRVDVLLACGVVVKRGGLWGSGAPVDISHRERLELGAGAVVDHVSVIGRIADLVTQLLKAALGDGGDLTGGDACAIAVGDTGHMGDVALLLGFGGGRGAKAAPFRDLVNRVGPEFGAHDGIGAGAEHVGVLRERLVLSGALTPYLEYPRVGSGDGVLGLEPLIV